MSTEGQAPAKKQGFNLREAAAIIGISASSLCRLKARGEIAYRACGGRVVFTEQHIADYLERSERPAIRSLANAA